MTCTRSFSICINLLKRVDICLRRIDSEGSLMFASITVRVERGLEDIIMLSSILFDYSEHVTVASHKGLLDSFR